jgi:hypothetical protein
LAVLRFVFDSSGNPGRVSRREWLRIGGLTGLGLLGARGASADNVAVRSAGFGRAKSVIFVFASGGQSQLDMWDPKPLAPEDVRGEFQAISSAVPGVALGEHMPLLAKAADRYTIVRSMSHDDLDHGSAAYLALTGRFHEQKSANPDPRPIDLPTYGAVLRRVRPTSRFVYDAVHVNGPALVPTRPAPGQDGGFLGQEFAPLVVGDVSQNAVAVPGLESQPELPTVRLDERRSLKESLDRYYRGLAENEQATAMSQLYGQALAMLASPQCRQAFDLHAEPASVRERYGLYRSGQGCLLARRLVEAGVPLVTVMFNHSNRGQDTAPADTDLYGWDTHNDIFESLKVHLLPRFDWSFSALLEDLDRRGLLDETLVVCMGEFGRAPKVAFEGKFAGRTPGRKHWAAAYSVVVAGAGVQRGALVGATDRLGGEVVTDRYGPWDMAATMFSALGVDPSGHYYDALDRPYPITIGKPIEALYRS